MNARAINDQDFREAYRALGEMRSSEEATVLGVYVMRLHPGIFHEDRWHIPGCDDWLSRHAAATEIVRRAHGAESAPRGA